MSSDTKIIDLTVDELTLLIQKIVKQTMTDLLGDPDDGLEIRDSIKARLQYSLSSVSTGPKTTPVQDVAAKLGLD